MDWEQAKLKYVTDPSVTYRSLAEEYGVSQTQVANHSRDEGWRKLREEHLQNICKKTMNQIANQQANRMVRLQNVADKLLSQLESIVDDFDLQDLVLDKTSLKQITGALKDIKDIQNLKSDKDMEEQEARIAKLRKDAEKEDPSNDISINIGGWDEKWRG